MKRFLALCLATFAFSAFSASHKTTGPTQLDDLIRGEMAAVKAYDTLISKSRDKKELASLKAMRADHVKAVETLKAKNMNRDVAEDTRTVGPWGTFAESWVAGGKLFGDKAALRALRQGEEHGIDEYEEALEDDDISADIKRVIRDDLLPRQKAHLKTINSYL